MGRKTKLHVVILSLLAIALYFPYNLTISSWDESLFVNALETNSLAHGSGFKVYLDLASLVNRFLSNSIFSLRVLSYIPSIIVILLTYYLGSDFIKDKKNALLLSLILMIMPLFWFHAISIEAYPIAMMFGLFSVLMARKKYYKTLWLSWAIAYSLSKMSLLYFPLLVLLFLNPNELNYVKNNLKYIIKKLTIAFGVLITIFFLFYYGTPRQYYVFSLNEIFHDFLKRILLTFSPMNILSLSFILPFLLYFKSGKVTKAEISKLIIVPFFTLALFIFNSSIIDDIFIPYLFTYPFLVIIFGFSLNGLLRNRRHVYFILIGTIIVNLILVFSMPIGVRDKVLNRQFHYEKLVFNLKNDFTEFNYLPGRESTFVTLFLKDKAKMYNIYGDKILDEIKSDLNKNKTVLLNGDAFMLLPELSTYVKLLPIIKEFEIELVKTYNLDPWYLWIPQYVNIYKLGINQEGNTIKRYEAYLEENKNITIFRNENEEIIAGEIFNSKTTNIFEKSKVYTFSDADGIVFLN